MRALVYRNTKTTIPGWVPIHDGQPRGIAYETDTHFVHFYGRDSGIWIISTGLTVTEKKVGSLRPWVERTFGATEIEDAVNEVGHTNEGVWRPGLLHSDEIAQGLAFTIVEARLAEQSMLLIIQRLDELMLFVEPTPDTLKTHSHKARELLILACTEVENYWKHYMRRSGVSTKTDFTTNDYVKLREPLCLPEYDVSLPRYDAVPAIRPFENWDPQSPTQSLPWYAAYNRTKHDRTSNFADASLWNCIQSVAANIVMLCVRFGPFRLFHGGGTLGALFNQTFAVELRNCKPASFYSPSVQLPSNQRDDLICFESKNFIQPRVVQPLKL